MRRRELLEAARQVAYFDQSPEALKRLRAAVAGEDENERAHGGADDDEEDDEDEEPRDE